jgi:glutathione-regulated potassium-efflux system ancillary protein KefG
MKFAKPFVMYESETMSHSAIEKEAERYRDYIDSQVKSLGLLSTDINSETEEEA